MLLLAGNVLLNLALVPIVLCMLLAVVYAKTSHFRSVRTITVRVWLALCSAAKSQLMRDLFLTGRESQQDKMERPP